MTKLFDYNVKKTNDGSNPALNSDAKGFRSLSVAPPFCAG